MGSITRWPPHRTGARRSPSSRIAWPRPRRTNCDESRLKSTPAPRAADNNIAGAARRSPREPPGQLTLSPGPLRHRPRTLRLLLALTAAPLLVLVLAGPASAHATLLFAIPTADGSVPDAPGTLTLVFN